jgi:hypothetical protein
VVRAVVNVIGGLAVSARHHTHVTTSCHLSRATLLAELREYETALDAIERSAQRLGADDPLLVDHLVRRLIHEHQGRWIEAVLSDDGGQR